VPRRLRRLLIESFQVLRFPNIRDTMIAAPYLPGDLRAGLPGISSPSPAQLDRNQRKDRGTVEP
jgi:hypothetical protein